MIEKLCIEANQHLPEDVGQALRCCRRQEDWEIAQGVLDQIIENFEIARQEQVPICQDSWKSDRMCTLREGLCLRLWTKVSAGDMRGDICASLW